MNEHTFDPEPDAEPTDHRSLMAGVEELTGTLIDTGLARLEKVASLDESLGYLADGYTSVASFLVHRCGMGVGEANRTVFLARSLVKVRYAAKLAAAGRLSLNQVEVLAHAEAKHPDQYATDEPTLAEAVSGLLLTDTRRLMEYWCQAHCEPADQAVEPSTVFLSGTIDGRGRLDGDLDPETHTLLAQALDSLMSQIVATTPADELAPAPQRRAQALAEIARRHLDSPDTPVDHGNRPHLTVVVDWEVLAGARRDKTCELIDGTVITPDAARRLACDANVCRLLTGPQGEILDMGRSRRSVTPGQWKALRLRDRHCQFPGCRRPWAWCDAHHIRQWTRDYGPTDLDNLVLLCRYHHSLIHDGGWTLAGTPGDLTIARPDGTPCTHDPP